MWQEVKHGRSMRMHRLLDKGIGRGRLITMNEAEIIEAEEGIIHVIPLLHLLLGSVR